MTIAQYADAFGSGSDDDAIEITDAYLESLGCRKAEQPG